MIKKEISLIISHYHASDTGTRRLDKNVGGGTDCRVFYFLRDQICKDQEKTDITDKKGRVRE